MIKFKLNLKPVKKFFKRSFLYFLVTLNLILYSYISFSLYYQNKIYPHIEIAGQTVGGLTETQALQKLKTEFSRRNKPINLTYQNQIFELDLVSPEPKVDFDKEVKLAYSLGRSNGFFPDLTAQGKTLIYGQKFTPQLNFNRGSLLTSQISNINSKVKQSPKSAQIILGENVTIVPSENGQELDDQKLLQQINDYLTLASQTPTTLPIKITPARLSTEDVLYYKKLVDSLKDSPIKLTYQNQTLLLDQATLLSLLNFQKKQQNLLLETMSQNIKPTTDFIDPDKLAAYLEDLSISINRPPQDAKFNFNPLSKKVQEFKPAQEGRELDLAQTNQLIVQSLTASPSAQINLPIKVTQPKNTTAETNNFGITDLLASGVSNFSGSIENRIYNVSLAAIRINGTLIAPNQVFSFNNTVGDISASSGYKQAYVIKEGRTVLDDGGGVCQVSTTLFRAVLNAGLPVVSRTAHAYRVGYYEQGFPPGLDATVFSPSVDFKFKNDTSSYILIQAYAVGTRLYFDLYGAPDGRVINLTKPVISELTPPPPELRQDDPTLPKGTVKQVDWAAWGAKVSFKRTVTKGGEIILSETWVSNYKPWQAIYLVGTKEN